MALSLWYVRLQAPRPNSPPQTEGKGLDADGGNWGFLVRPGVLAGEFASVSAGGPLNPSDRDY